jgi:PAS domain S-box-containing protein
VLGCLVLIGWVFHIGILIACLPGFVSMKANTALSLGLSGLSLWLLLPEEPGARTIQVGRSIALVVMLICVATITEYLFGLHLGIDQFLFVDTMVSPGTSSPGRMAPMTATGLTAIGIALMLLNTQNPRRRYAVQSLGLLAGLLAMMSISGYVYHATAPYRLLLYTQIAVHTAFGLFLLGGAIFFARPRSGIAGDLTGAGPGSVMARRLLPAILLIPLLLGWVCMRGKIDGLYDVEMELVLFATADVVIFGVLIWLTARRMNAEYEQRSRAEVQLQELNACLEKRVEERTKAFERQWHIFDATLSSVLDFAYTFDSEGRFRYVNQQLLNLWGITEEDAVGKTHHELPYGQELAERLHQQVLEVFATGQKFVGQTEYTSPAGVVGHFEYFFCPVIGVGSDVESVAGATIDITARKAAEAHLVQMEARYRGLLEAAPDAMVVVNQSGEIVLLNVQAEKRFGYHRDELIGQKVKNLIPEGFAERLIADGTRTAAEALAQQIGTGIELNGRRKDGSEFPIEIMLSPLESTEGILVTAAIRDISVRRAAKAYLMQMESRYRGLLEAAPDGMVVVNQGGDIVLLNVQAEKQFGYSRNELVGQKVKNLIPEGFAERLIADGTRTAAEALAQQIGTGIELNGRRRDGTEFPIEIMLSPLESAEGILVTAAIRDISVRRAAEEHLVQMEGRYRGLLEAAPDAMVVVDQGGEIVLLNVQAEKQFGYSRDELIGQRVTNIIPEGFAERLIADGTRTAAEALAQQIGTGIELIGLRKDGSEFPIEIMLSPLESVDGILVTAAIRDISVRRAAEEHLVQMESRYRGLLEAAPDAMVVVNRGGEIVLLNVQAEKQFGYSRDELVGQKVKNIIPEGFAERLIADALRSTEDALAQQIGTGIELNGRRKDGSEFPIEIMLSPLESVEGILVTAAIRNITMRKEAEAQLEYKVEELSRSNEELEQFAYIASHDLQEPLRMVASYTQLLARRYKGKLDADADEFIFFAVDGAQRMQRLIQDLLAFSRIGTQGKSLTDISSEKALQQALMNLGGAIEMSGAVVTHNELPDVEADETQLVQLFQNLVGNAIKYQKQELPRVHISAAKNGGKKWKFSVQDNGLGIEPQYFDKIFGMFQRLHKREEYAGTGIGLAICKKIVERHGGTISVESEPGQGSTFHFALAGSKKNL